MEVLGISCSPRKGGNTDILVQEALAGAKDVEAKTEFLTIRDKNIKGCIGCDVCRKDGVCSIQDDMQDIYPKLLKADGIVLGTPVYFWSMCGQAKIFIDRTYALRHPYLRLSNKVGGIIVVAGRTGCFSTINGLVTYMMSNHMVVAEAIDALAYHPGEVRKDEQGMKTAWELGRLVALLTKQQFKYPKEYELPYYQIYSDKYKGPKFPKT